MEKFKKILVCWKRIYSAEKELMEVENSIKPEEKKWYEGAESAIESILFCLKRIEENKENNPKNEIKKYDENTIKKELENMKKIEEWAKKI